MGSVPMMEGSAGQGGVFVPAPVRQAVLGRLATASAVRRLAQVIPMSSLTLSLPRITAGVAAEWVSEGGATGSDTPVFDALTLTAHKLAVLVPVTEELLADATTGIAAVVAQILADSFAAKEDQAFLGFDAGGPIAGLYGSTGVTPIPYSGDIVADSAAALAAIEANGYEPTGFIANPRVKAQLRAAKDGSGRYIFAPGESVGAPDMLWGVPIVFSRQVPSTMGTGGDGTCLIAGDWRQFLIGDRQDLTLTRSTEATYTVGAEIRSAFQRHEVLLRAEERIDAVVADPGAFAVIDLIGATAPEEE